MLATQALVVVRVPSSHSDASITLLLLLGEPSRENLLKGPRTAAEKLCAPPRAGGTELHHKWGSSDGHFRAIWSQQSGGFGQTDDRPAHPTARHWRQERRHPAADSTNPNTRLLVAILLTEVILLLILIFSLD